MKYSKPRKIKLSNIQLQCHGEENTNVNFVALEGTLNNSKEIRKAIAFLSHAEKWVLEKEYLNRVRSKVKNAEL